MVGTRPAKIRSDSTVGTVLRQARAQRRLSVAAVTAALKIPAHHVQALEEGDLSVFAAEVYARAAFIKYADFLGVRADATQRAFLRVLAGAREYVPLKVHRPRPWLYSMLTPRLVLAALLLGLALLAGSYLVWQVQSFLRLPALAVRAPTSDVILGASVTIEGKTETDAHVQVNGENALLDSSGQFSIPLLLHPGINIVQIEATNAAGRKRTTTRHLLMPRS